MSTPLEHDYIGLSEVPAMDASENSSLSEEEGGKGGGLKYKETELRLGLPGSESPERKVEKSFLLGAGAKNFMLGSKRGFSDAIDGPGKWVLSGGGSSEVEAGKGAALFSPRGGKEGSVQQPSLVVAAQAVKEAVKPSPQEKKPQISTATDHGAAPAAK